MIRLDINRVWRHSLLHFVRLVFLGLATCFSFGISLSLADDVLQGAPAAAQVSKIIEQVRSSSAAADTIKTVIDDSKAASPPKVEHESNLSGGQSQDAFTGFGVNEFSQPGKGPNSEAGALSNSSNSSPNEAISIRLDPGRIEPPMISLIVADTPLEHIREAIEHLTQLCIKKKVYLRGIFIISKTASSDSGSSWILDSAIKKAFERLTSSGQELGLRLVEKPPERYKHVKRSPVWIVNYQGKDHVFQGLEDPSGLFDEDGEFVKGEAE